MEKSPLLDNIQRSHTVKHAFGSTYTKCSAICSGLTGGMLIAIVTNLDCQSIQTLKIWTLAMSMAALCVPICSWFGYEDTKSELQEIENAGGPRGNLKIHKVGAIIYPIISIGFLISNIVILSIKWNCSSSSNLGDSSSSSSF